MGGGQEKVEPRAWTLAMYSERVEVNDHQDRVDTTSKAQGGPEPYQKISDGQAWWCML